MTVYNVFIASPSDTQKERDIVSKLIDEWNSLNSELHGITLKSMRWEKDAVPVLGASAQQAINSQLLDNADFLIGIFNKKFGAPTDEYPCATAEEIERHMDSGRPGMLFFCNEKVTRDEAFNNDDLRNIEELKRKYQKKTFYKEYTSMRYAARYVDLVWNTARKLGYGKFFVNADGGAITDDHQYVIAGRGIPCLDIIHFNPNNDSGFAHYWHTMNDTMENIDRETLKAVGQTVLEVIYNR